MASLPDPAEPRPGPWALGLGLLLTAALYVESLGYDFVWDDFLLLQPAVFHRLSSLLRFFVEDFTALTDGVFQGHYYRPILGVTLTLESWLWGLLPGPFHLTNLLLHLAATALLARVVVALGGGGLTALLTALLFGLHPAHVEAVVFVSARDNLCLTLGLLGALRLYLAAYPPGRPRRPYLLAALLAEGFACLSKEAAVILPAVLLATDGLVLGARDGLRPAAAWGRAARRSLPFAALAAAFLLFRLPAAVGMAGGSLTPALLWERLPGALETYARYLRLSLLPAFMEPFYPQWRPDSLLAPWPLLGAATLALTLGLLGRWARRLPLAAFALAFFLATLLPVVDLVPISVRRMGLTDRYLYLPSAGIALLLALGIAALLRGGLPARRAGWAALLLVLTAYPALTLAYAPVFRDSIALFSRMERAAPHNPLPPFNLGLAYLEAGRQAEAAEALERSLRLDPTRARARATLGFLRVFHGRRAEGFRLLDSLAGLPDLDYTYYLNRTKAHLFVGELPQALAVAAEGVRRFPARPDLQEWYGRALGHAGRLDEAVAAYRTALRLAPDLCLAEEALGLALARQGRLGEARLHLERAAAGLPDRVAPRRALALLLAEEGQAAESARRWQEVLQLAPDGAAIREAILHLRHPAAAGVPR